MFMFTYDSLKLDEERIIELIDRTKYIRTVFYNMYEKSNTRNRFFDVEIKASKSVSLYKKYFKEELSLEERTVVLLYFIITDDNKLSKEFLTYKGDFALIGKNYGVNKDFAALRWMIQRKVIKYNKNIKKLTLTNKDL